MHALLKFLLWTFGIYAVYCGLLFVLQRQIMFPRGMIPQPGQDLPKIAGLARIWLQTDSGKIEAWLVPPAAGSAAGSSPAVIFGHGNGELIDYWPEELMGFNRLGFAVMLVEYPGYGRSTGTPSQKSITDAFVRAYDTLAARKDIDPTRIVLVGRSLGGGAVCALSLKRPSAAMILMSTFTSARSFAKRYLAPPFLVRDPMDNLAAVRKYNGPILIMHGRQDTVIPYSHGNALKNASVRGRLITYEAGHNDCPPDWTIFWSDVAAFLRENKIGVLE
jgi:pimeloyl-ACP methyl ester carboxylesterase